MLFRQRRKIEDFNAEMKAHLQLEADRLRAEGMSEADAHFSARRAFGNSTQFREQFYESRWWSAWERWGQDLRFALRIFLKHRGTTGLAIVIVALALGTNTAIFSILNAALFESLPVSHPEDLVMLTDPNASMVLGGFLLGARSLLTYSEFAQLQSHVTTLSSLCAVELTLDRWPIRIADSEPEQATGRLVSEDYFSTLGLRPAVGRFFTEHDAKAVGQDPYAVLSYGYWQQRFGGNPAVLGTTVRIRNASVVILGVAPRDFHGVTVGQEPDLWVPLLMQPLVLPSFDGLRDTLPHSTDKLMWLHVLGRRKHGVSLAQVQSEVNVLFRAILKASYPPSLSAETRSRMLDQHLVIRPVRTGAFHGRQAFSQEWALLQALAGLILLVACANVASLLLARVVSRSREVATRLALGARWTRLAAQFVTEHLLLAGLSGAASLLMGEAILRFLLKLLSESRDGFILNARLDLHVVAFSAGATIMACLLFGAVPVIQALRHSTGQSLQEMRRMTVPRKRRTFGKGLVIAQVALSLLLLIGAGLFLRSLWNLQSVDLGYPEQNLSLVQIDSSDAGYVGARASGLFQDLAQRIEQIPGVRSVSYSDRGLLTGFGGAFPVHIEGFHSTREEDLGSAGDLIGPDYFATLGIPILKGRAIAKQDLTNAPKVCVINQAFAQRFFRHRNPLGRYVTTVLPDEKGNDVQQRLRVIGVVRNAREQSIRDRIEPRFYAPGNGSWLVLRTTSNPGSILKAVRKIVFSLDPKLAIQSSRTLQQALAEQTISSKILTQLATGFALLALLLAGTGVYGLLSYELGQRRPEIGIRMALGAQPGQITRMILGEAGRMIIVGMVSGLVLTALCIGVFASQLYGFDTGPRWALAHYQHVDSATRLYEITAWDPVTISAVAAVLFAFGLLAAWLPALRASRVDPISVLHNE